MVRCICKNNNNIAIKYYNMQFFKRLTLATSSFYHKKDVALKPLMSNDGPIFTLD